MAETANSFDLLRVICIGIGVAIGFILVNYVLGIGGIVGGALGGGLGAVLGIGIHAVVTKVKK